MRLGVNIQRDNNYNHVKINTNDHEGLKQALEEELGIDCGRWGFNTEESHKLTTALRKLFDTHSQFYSYFGFDGGVEHGPTGQRFDSGGWRKFLNENFDVRYARYIEDEEDLQLFCEAIAERLKDALESHDDQLIPDEENFVAKSTVTVDAEPSGQLTEPEMLEDAVVVSDNGVHKLNVQTVEDAETLDDVKQQVEEDTKGVYEKQVEARIGMLKNRISNLQERLEEERRNMLVKGIEMVNELENWKVEDGYLVYTETIHLQTAQHKNKDDDPTELTEEAKERFYIQGLKVPINKKIKKPKYEDAYHPHGLSSGMCSGSFRAEMSQEGLQDVVEQMKQADLHGHAHTDAERELKENFEEYTKGGEDEEDGAVEEVWEA